MIEPLAPTSSPVRQDYVPRNEVDFRVCVAITTYNRSRLLSRAIHSVLSQHWAHLELIVIDDASTDGTPDLMQSCFSHLRFLRQTENRGLGAARNRGLKAATQPWVIFLDDDDTLSPQALARIARHVARYPDAEQYPVLQFACSNGRADSPFLVARMADYVTERVRGDFVPVINRHYFLSEGLAYGELRAVGGGLMWWRIADKYGIPTWAEPMVEVRNDAPLRMTSTEYQLRHARDFAELQEHTLREFGSELSSRFPDYYQKKRLGSATYRLLAGEAAAAREQIGHSLRHRISLPALGLWLLTYLPRGFVTRCYESYRRREAGRI